MDSRNIVYTTLTLPLLLNAYSVAYAADESVDDSFSSDFTEDDTALFEKARWSNGGMFDCVFSSNNVSFEDGIMTLSITENTNSKYSYDRAGAEYRTLNYYGYGYYQVSMMPISNPGVVSSFFTFSGKDDSGAWDEIDIEFLGKDTTCVQFNYYVNGNGHHEYVYDLGFDATADYHNYSFLWQENMITWFVDDVAVYQVDAEDGSLPSLESKIMMNVWNGANSVNYWLDEYDGTIPLHAYYDTMSYTSLSQVDSQILESAVTFSTTNHQSSNSGYIVASSFFGIAIIILFLFTFIKRIRD